MRFCWRFVHLDWNGSVLVVIKRIARAQPLLEVHVAVLILPRLALPPMRAYTRTILTAVGVVTGLTVENRTHR